MICKIADLIVDVPTAGGLAPRCVGYLWNEDVPADITIHGEKYRRNKYDPRLPEEIVAYMESAYQFYLELVKYDGFYLHSSAVVRDGKAYLFSGPCRVGKSTHAGLWQKTFGPEVFVINDDKPALRRIDGKWYAYGTPWCGKDGINRNACAPVAGVCFLKQGPENKIRLLSVEETMHKVLTQTIYKFDDVSALDAMLRNLERFITEVPAYELENIPEPSAARLSYETMSAVGQEAMV